jgi:hypothetical protein
LKYLKKFILKLMVTGLLVAGAFGVAHFATNDYADGVTILSDPGDGGR